MYIYGCGCNGHDCNDNRLDIRFLLCRRTSLRYSSWSTHAFKTTISCTCACPRRPSRTNRCRSGPGACPTPISFWTRPCRWTPGRPCSWVACPDRWKPVSLYVRCKLLEESETNDWKSWMQIVFNTFPIPFPTHPFPPATDSDSPPTDGVKSKKKKKIVCNVFETIAGDIWNGHNRNAIPSHNTYKILSVFCT